MFVESFTVASNVAQPIRIEDQNYPFLVNINNPTSNMIILQIKSSRLTTNN